MGKEPDDMVRRLEAEAALPTGCGEHFVGYGIMGLPFVSGHVLALRRFTASSIGPSYTSVWHRDPAGTWVFYAVVDPHHSCSRFFGNGLARSERSAITLVWDDPRRLTIVVWAAGLNWEVQLAETPTTSLLNGLSAAIPATLWHRPATLAAVAQIAGRTLGAGRLRLLGCTPNGQRFRAALRRLWVITESRAWIGGVDLGATGPLTPQAHLGDFLIPQRGLIVVGSTSFEPCREAFRPELGAPDLTLTDGAYTRQVAITG